MGDNEDRQLLIADTLVEAFKPLMEADAHGFRTKFRKMAADPFAFYRGSACLFYADMRELEDKWADENTGRVWIHGDLHAENFGTYMSSTGELTFDINDFDEAYLGHFSWDLRRFTTSLALMSWQKALPAEAVRSLARTYLSAYLEQVKHYDDAGQDDFALHLSNTSGTIHRVLLAARASRRTDLLDAMTLVEDHERHFRDNSKTRRLDEAEYEMVSKAFEGYLATIPEDKRSSREIFYHVKDIVGSKGFGIGSAGLPAYNVLIEGYNEALENDIIISMKQGNVAAPSRIVTDERVRSYFEHDGHRTVISQRALQVHTDTFLGYTTVDGVGFVVDELSPYKADLRWDNLTEPDEIEPVLVDLGRATAKVHCASDQDSEQDLVDFQTERAIMQAVDGRRDEFIDDIIEFSMDYAQSVRGDHALFVDAFRENRIPGVPST
ncbi:uncharacterized protein (DUF2252 family) [Arthrobacter pigmenti]|uniref:Uncharacterized protein (DUF2252 family) n=1 Tax=Arthrobacter pigmenti TaxID=271432 RepID=A0A846RVC7_9MICC|nr:DUF2252 domain-containing protein [Arthrobacter pigmenti]NJC23565.1 uncharacterized protein (DUF2252 family) [Arthrobacter pigmenti]